MADLSTLLGKEASTEIEAILSEARTRASEIVANAKRDAEALVAARERVAKAQREASLVQARSSAQLEAASLRLRAQYDGVQGVFDAAAREIEALPRAGAYPATFRKLVEEALAAVARDDVAALVVAPADQALAGETAAALGLTVPVETSGQVAGGVFVRTSKNNLVENTLLGRLRSLRDELASEVSAALFKSDAAA